MGKCGVNIGVRSEFEGKIQFMTSIHVTKPTTFVKKLTTSFFRAGKTGT